MRDPKRIDEFLNTFKVLWKTYPNLRFGQLVEKIKFEIMGSEDIFYLEEDELEAIMKDILNGF